MYISRLSHSCVHFRVQRYCCSLRDSRVTMQTRTLHAGTTGKTCLIRNPKACRRVQASPSFHGGRTSRQQHQQLPQVVAQAGIVGDLNTAAEAAQAVLDAAAARQLVIADAEPQQHTTAAVVEQPDPNADLWKQLSFSNRHSLTDRRGRLMLKNLTYSELEEWCVAAGEDPRRAKQLWRWMYYDNNWISSFIETVGQQSGLSAAFAAKAEGLASVDGGLLLEQVVAAQDGTKKLVFKLTEGAGAGGSIEAVLIPMLHRKGTRRHITLCVSSQVGCAMNCQFCYTGRMGLSGNLSTAQIIEQMVVACRVLAAEPGEDKAAVTNVVFMGMGEPLDNLDAVMAAVDIMTHPLGLHMSRQKVTVSTVGLVDRLKEFAARSNAPHLALSLHATTDEVRDWIVPVNRRYKLSALMDLLRRHYASGNSSGRRVLVEYTMLAGVNDSLEDATRLLQLLEGVEAKVNLICFNPFAGTRFRSSPMDQILAFRSVLIQGGRVCTIRDSRGDDEMAACGQLGNPLASAKSAPILEPPERFKAVLAAV